MSKNEKETFDFGAEFARHLGAGSVVALFGQMGSGKTTCIRGICAGLDVLDDVTSPTFTIINEYRGRLPIYHFDFYRFGSEAELLELGLEEYFWGSGICLVEWPEIASKMLPTNRFEIHLTWNIEAGWKNRRKIVVHQSKNGRERK
jgi:tRNA threonylcarbamoyladenosine biosynthesis protein TsaE